MAIESSNRSPSPMSFRQNPNANFSNSRNQADKRGEGGIRRSASGGSPFSKPSVVAHPSAWCFTPKTTSANSPAELGRRNSFSDINEHKENKKPNPNLKPIKGTKNFMSPTISAVSKVTPSPRKKALAERNEAVRTSASLSDGKFLFFAAAGDDDLKSETENFEFQKEFQEKEEIHVSTCEAKKRVTFDDDVVVLSPEVFSGYDVDEPSELLFASEMIEPIDYAQNEPCLDVSKTTSFVSAASPIAPLDADPCIQPYDPKTNYLSPRPQFLRYKPSEEVSLNLNNHLLKNFEDTLSSETCSDNDMESTVEEVQSEEAPVQEEESLGSSCSSSSVKLESSDESTQAQEEEVSEGEEETSVESEIVSKPRFFRRGRIITWLLFGVVALLSSMIVSHAPPESVLSKVYQYNHPIYEFADLSGSLHRMKKWSSTYLPLMISSFRESDDEFTPSEFLNFSALICDANDHFVEHKASGFPSGKVEFVTEKGNGVVEETKMDSDSEEMALLQSSKLLSEQDVHTEQIGQVELGYSGEDQFIEESGLPSHPEIEPHPNLEANHEEVEEDQFIEESGLLSHPEIEIHPNLEADHEEAEVQSYTQFEESGLPSHPENEPHPNLEANHEEDQFIEESGLPSHPEIEIHPNLDANHEEVEVQSNSQFEETELPISDDPELELDSKAKGQPVIEEVASQQTHFTEQIENENEVGLDDLEHTGVESGEAEVPAQGAVMFLVASLCVAATAFSGLAMFSKYKNKAGVKPISTEEQAEILVRKEDSIYGNPSHRTRMEAVDMDAENPSEMSSFSYSFYDKREEARGTESEAHSKEEERKQPRRNYKRESLASSSSEYTRRGSVSYGSFTTYSVMPTKKGDEEVVTPVRRSSRIRKQLVSP